MPEPILERLAASAPLSDLIAPLVIAPLLAALVSFLLGRLLIRHATRLGLQDLPNERSSHATPRPRGGGAGILLAFLVTLPFGVPAGIFLEWNTVLPLAAAVMLALVGLADDLAGLGLAVRLGAQALAVAALLAALAWSSASGESDLGILSTFSGLPALSAWLSANAAPWLVITLDILLIPLLLLGGIWWINLFNFMDGIDGLAASQALFMLVGAMIIKLAGTGVDTGLADLAAAPAQAAGLLLASATVGFLLLNWPPARLFMGDAGSLFLGFSILALGAHDVTFGDMSLWSWLLLGGMFLVDATITLLRRWLTGQSVTAAHRSHLYQRLSRRWGRHAPVTLVYFLVNLAWFFPLSFLAHRAPPWAPMILVMGCLPAAIVAWRAGAGLKET